jgi:hypothetical protein
MDTKPKKLTSVGPPKRTYADVYREEGEGALVDALMESGVFRLDVEAQVSRAFTDDAATHFLVRNALELHGNAVALDTLARRFGWGDRGGRRIRSLLEALNEHGVLTTRGVPGVGTVFYFANKYLPTPPSSSIFTG